MAADGSASNPRTDAHADSCEAAAGRMSSTG